MKEDVLQEVLQVGLEVAKERGIEVAGVVGPVAVEGAMKDFGASVDTSAEAQTPYTKESIREQLSSAYNGHKAVVKGLNDGGEEKDKIEPLAMETLTKEFEAWFTDEKLAEVNATQKADSNTSFMLVATPNVLVNADAVIKIANAFGKGQPHPTRVDSGLYYPELQSDMFNATITPEQWSGTHPDNGNRVLFSLIPSTFTQGEEQDAYYTQRAELAELQKIHPDLKVPSVLEAIIYWQTLRATGDKLADDTTIEKTYIRHFDFPDQKGIISRDLDVPLSYITAGGQPRLSSLDVRYKCGARLSIG